MRPDEPEPHTLALAEAAERGSCPWTWSGELEFHTTRDAYQHQCRHCRRRSRCRCRRRRSAGRRHTRMLGRHRMTVRMDAGQWRLAGQGRDCFALRPVGLEIPAPPRPPASRRCGQQSAGRPEAPSRVAGAGQQIRRHPTLVDTAAAAARRSRQQLQRSPRSVVRTNQALTQDSATPRQSRRHSGRTRMTRCSRQLQSMHEHVTAAAQHADVKAQAEANVAVFAQAAQHTVRAVRSTVPRVIT